jgi:ribokinase
MTAHKRARVAVIGSANTDLVTFTERFPRAGETLFGASFHLGFGGKGANQAVAARLCGAEVLMVAHVGNDLFGPATISNFAASGVDVRHVRMTDGVSSGVATISVEPDGQNRILVVKGANDALLPGDIEAAAADLQDVDYIVLQLEIPLETVYYAVGFAASHAIACILNPAPAQPLDLERLRSVAYFIPNETEAEVITGMPVATVEEAQACAGTLLERGLQRVIITLGANGAVLGTADGLQHVPPFQVIPKDSTGAGDAFIGSFATFLAEGLAEREAVERANLYAALSTLNVGTQASFWERGRFEEERRSRRT